MRRIAQTYPYRPKVRVQPGAVAMLIAGDTFMLSPKEAIALANDIADAVDKLDQVNA